MSDNPGFWESLKRRLISPVKMTDTHITREVIQKDVESFRNTVLARRSTEVTAPPQFQPVTISKIQTHSSSLSGTVPDPLHKPKTPSGEWREFTDCEGNTFEVFTRNFTPTE